jgi:anti-sigma B factor antagonist
MAFKLTTRTLGEITVLDLSGRLEVGQGSVVLRETLQNSSLRGAKILINLANVSFIDTSGLGELVSGHTTARNEGGQLKLSGMPARVEHLFHMTGLDRIFDTYGNEADAIHSWGESLVSSDRVLSETAA